MSRRGFTLVEMLVVSALTVIIVGTLAALYLHVTTRTAHTVADVSTVIQHQQVLESIERVATNAMVCQVVTASGNTGLRCTLPNDGTDWLEEGFPSKSFVPSNVSRRQIAKYAIGQRVWFYMADSTGNFANTGTILWRASRNDDLIPTAGDADTSWAFHYGTTSPRWNLVENISFTIDADSKAVTVSLTTSAVTREDRKRQAGDDASLAYALPSSRTFYWRHWRR